MRAEVSSENLVMRRSIRTRPVIAVVFAAALAASQAHATTLSGNLTSDDAFYAYISTNNSVLGTPVYVTGVETSSGGTNGAGGIWWGYSYSFTGITLTPGQTYYLQIEAINYSQAAGFIGDFTLSGSGFTFANGQQELLTNTANWVGGFNSSLPSGYNQAGPNFAPPPSSWVEPGGGVYSQGSNGQSGLPWNSASWAGEKPVTNIGTGAQWIWPSDSNSSPYGGPPGNGYWGCQNCYVDFSTEISPTATPLPAALPLFATGLGAMGLLGWRRKRKVAAQVAA